MKPVTRTSSSARHNGIIIAILMFVLALVIWYASRPQDTDQRMTASQLGALSDDQIVKAAYSELSQRVTTHGERGVWQRFEEPARNVWSLAMVEIPVKFAGIDGFMKMPFGREAPSLSDAQGACAAMGLDEASQVLVEAIAFAKASPPGPMSPGPMPPKSRHTIPEKPIVGTNPWFPLNQRFRVALERPESAQARITYVRKHLEEIAHPWH